ncbi:hypothetical protein VNO77_14433 [Canavalia gladiata]|uniref:Uncharacterized protein n=1 Tax=Canavalia gladiata TaxID=3824 RepID=A0AAN9QS01_CANGL
MECPYSNYPERMQSDLYTQITQGTNSEGLWFIRGPVMVLHDKHANSVVDKHNNHLLFQISRICSILQLSEETVCLKCGNRSVLALASCNECEAYEVMRHVPFTEVSMAVMCNTLQLSACANAITSSNLSTPVCCSKMKDQRSCLCQYLKDPNIKRLVNFPNARKSVEVVHFFMRKIGPQPFRLRFKTDESKPIVSPSA